MRLVPIQLCKPGMRLAKKIYGVEGVVLLNEHAELNEYLIERLSELGISRVYIEDSRTDDLVVPDLLSDETRRLATIEIRSQFRRMMEERSRSPYVRTPLASKVFRDIMQMIVDDLSNHQDAMIMLTNMNVTDHYLYQHSLNVCTYATMMGLVSGYRREELINLGLGALLHDIGKTQVPVGMLRKPGKLTPDEFAELKRHTVYGFRILKQEPNIPLVVADCAYQHHERMDGSGYPRGIQRDEIHEYAQWIGIADVYDALTTDRVYRGALPADQAMKIMRQYAGIQFEAAKLNLFQSKIAVYPLGSEVLLNTGERGVVVDLNASSPFRPIVRILANEANEELSAPYEVDLSKHPEIEIFSSL